MLHEPFGVNFPAEAHLVVSFKLIFVSNVMEIGGGAAGRCLDICRYGPIKFEILHVIEAAILLRSLVEASSVDIRLRVQYVLGHSQ